MTERWFGAGVFDNLHLKGFSLVLALGLWTVVPDPSLPQIVRDVPVQLDNIPAELALAENVTVELDISLSGSAGATQSLGPGQLAPTIDTSNMFEGDNTVAITAEMIAVPFGVTVDRIDPPQITVTFERRVHADLLVNAVVEGSPHTDYQIYDKVVAPPVITVSGPASRMEGLESIATEKVGVTGLQESLTRTVRVLPDDALLRVEDSSDVVVTVAIAERPVNLELQGIDVAIANMTTRTVVNPAVIGVILRGPPSLLAELTPANFVATVDVEGLAPRADDYRLEPLIRLEPAELANRVEVVTITPQRRLDVHVFPDR